MSMALARPERDQARPVPPRAAADRLNAARSAMGGAAAIAAVKSLRFQFSGRDLLGSLPGVQRTEPMYSETRNTVRVLFPDHFIVVTEQLSPYPNPPRAWGMAGRQNIGVPGPVDRITVESFGQLMLPLVLRTDTPFPFTLTGAQNDTLEFIDDNGFPASIDLDPSTNLPRQVRYQRIARSVEGEDRGHFPMRVEVGDYRLTGPLRLPHLLRTFQGERLVQERRLQRIDVNPALTVGDFR
jgi:hypothetical protein